MVLLISRNRSSGIEVDSIRTGLCDHLRDKVIRRSDGELEENSEKRIYVIDLHLYKTTKYDGMKSP